MIAMKFKKMATNNEMEIIVESPNVIIYLASLF